MKKLIYLLCLLALLTALCSGVSAAENELPRFIAREGLTTVLIGRDGSSETFDGVPDMSSVGGQYTSYTVFRHGEAQLTVKLPPDEEDGAALFAAEESTNGHYSVTLTLGEHGEYTAFLAGLTREYASELQAASIEAILTKTELELTDMSFIDTEKQDLIFDEKGDLTDTDSELCWAASTSNLLTYTGWAEQAGIYSTDYMFERFAAEFSNTGGVSIYGLQWFFNGINPTQDMYASDEEGYDSFVGYLPQYCVSELAEYIPLYEQPWRMPEVLRALQNGYGVEISYSHFYNRQILGGHSITLWGLVYETDADLTYKDAWKAIIISDSDNDRTQGENRRTAPNSLTLYAISPSEGCPLDGWVPEARAARYADGTEYLPIVDSVTLLKPYSDDLPTDQGKCDTVSYPDPVLGSIGLVVSDENNATPYLAADSPWELGLHVYNDSKAEITEDVHYTIRITTDNGEGVDTVTGILHPQEIRKGQVKYHSYDPLASGTYLVTAEISYDGNEAYLGNNRLTREFTVSSRARSQDYAVKVSAEAFFDGPPNKAYYGSDCIGRLSLNWSNDLGYAVRQYIMGLQYEDGYEDIYRSAVRPENVYGVRPVGNKAIVSIYAIPEDPLLGYERLVTTQEIDLRYAYVSTESEEQTFTPIHVGDTALQNGESIQFTVKKAVTNDDSKFFLKINARSETGSEVTIGGGSLRVSGFHKDNTLTIRINKFLTDLPEGENTIIAYLYYTKMDGIDDYYYGDAVTLGTLTVLPYDVNVSETDCQSINPLQTVICVSGNADAADDLTATLRFGTDSSPSYWMTESCGNGFEGGAFSISFTVPTQPGQTYYYDTEISIDGSSVYSGGIRSFTTPAVTETLDAESEIELRSKSETVYCYLPEEDGVCRFTASGDGGTLSVWENNEWRSAEISPIGCSLSTEAEADCPVYVMLSVREGECRLSTKAQGPSPVRQLLLPGCSKLKLAAGEVQYLTSCSADGDSTVTLRASGRDAALQYWDSAKQCWTAPTYFTADGTECTLSVAAGECVSYRLQSFCTDELSLSETIETESVTLGEEAELHFTAEADMRVLAAVYNADGQMLELRYKALYSGEAASFRFTQPQIASLRRFVLPDDIVYAD